MSRLPTEFEIENPLSAPGAVRIMG